MEFVFVPAGEFEMGSEEFPFSRPIHTVTIRNPFRMGKYQVTQAQWETVMGKNPSRFKGNGRLPVENVSWDDCQRFIEKLNALGDRNEYGLPSEAEWEYACRAGTTTRYSFGDILTTDQANYDGNFPYEGGPKGKYRKKTTPVGSFPANGFGIHDMHGNVWEWCQDRWQENYEGAPTDERAWDGGKGTERVMRGGCWDGLAVYCCSALRSRFAPENQVRRIGLRCVIRSAGS